MSLIFASNLLVLLLFLYYSVRKYGVVLWIFSLFHPGTYTGRKRNVFVVERVGDFGSVFTVEEWYLWLNGVRDTKWNHIVSNPIIKKSLTSQEISLMESCGMTLIDQQRSEEFLKTYVLFCGEKILCNKHSLVFYCLNKDNIYKTGFTCLKRSFVESRYKTELEKFKGLIREKYISSSLMGKPTHFSVLYKDWSERRISLWDFLPLLFQVINNERMTVVLNLTYIVLWGLRRALAILFSRIMPIISLLLKKELHFHKNDASFLGSKFKFSKNSTNYRLEIIPLFKSKFLNKFFERVLKYIYIETACDMFVKEFYKIDNPVVSVNVGQIPDECIMYKGSESFRRRNFYEMSKLIWNYFSYTRELRRFILSPKFNTLTDKQKMKYLEHLNSSYPNSFRPEGLKCDVIYTSQDIMFANKGVVNLNLYSISYRESLIRKMFKKWRGSRKYRLEAHPSEEDKIFSKRKDLDSYPSFLVRISNEEKSFSAVSYDMFKSFGMIKNSGKRGNEMKKGLKSIMSSKVPDIFDQGSSGHYFEINRSKYFNSGSPSLTESMLTRLELITKLNRRPLSTHSLKGGIIHVKNYTSGGGNIDNAKFKNEILFIYKKENVFVGADPLSNLEWVEFCDSTGIKNPKTCRGIFNYLNIHENIKKEEISLVSKFILKRCAFLRCSEMSLLGNSRWKRITSEISSYLSEKGFKFYKITKRVGHDGSKIKSLEDDNRLNLPDIFKEVDLKDIAPKPRRRNREPEERGDQPKQAELKVEDNPVKAETIYLVDYPRIQSDYLKRTEAFKQKYKHLLNPDKKPKPEKEEKKNLILNGFLHFSSEKSKKVTVSLNEISKEGIKEDKKEWLSKKKENKTNLEKVLDKMMTGSKRMGKMGNPLDENKGLLVKNEVIKGYMKFSTKENPGEEIEKLESESTDYYDFFRRITKVIISEITALSKIKADQYPVKFVRVGIKSHQVIPNSKDEILCRNPYEVLGEVLDDMNYEKLYEEGCFQILKEKINKVSEAVKKTSIMSKSDLGGVKKNTALNYFSTPNRKNWEKTNKSWKGSFIKKGFLGTFKKMNEVDNFFKKKKEDERRKEKGKEKSVGEGEKHGRKEWEELSKNLRPIIERNLEKGIDAFNESYGDSFGSDISRGKIIIKQNREEGKNVVSASDIFIMHKSKFSELTTHLVPFITKNISEDLDKKIKEGVINLRNLPTIFGEGSLKGRNKWEFLRGIVNFIVHK